MRIRVSKRSFAGVALAVAAVAIAGIAACGGGDFDPASKVDSVRIFAVKADKPFAKPGETVTLEALFSDARKEKPKAAKVYWIPVVCLNPQDDLYYLCFAPQSDAGTRPQGQSMQLVPVGALANSSGTSDAGTASPSLSGGDLLASLPTGVDLTPYLPQGPSFSFTMPQNAVIERKGSEPYGLAVVFNVVCAGRVEFAPRNAEGGAQQVPIVCTDETGKKLAPKDYVIGISRVYSWSTRANTNPQIESLTFKDSDVAANGDGITVEKCTTEKEKDCPENKIGIRVSESSWEANPSDITRDGELREQIWVDYYSDVGNFDDEARLLFDSRQGRIAESDVTFRAAKTVVTGTLWAVVHDNRGGVSWTQTPLRVR